MKKIQVNGYQMAYTDAGEGTPIVFVHGYPLNREMWQPQIEALSDSFRVLAVDLRGHGDSDPVPGPYSVDLLADDIRAFLDALRIDQPVVLCGLSMGGYIAFAFYRKYLDRLRGLILTATRAAADTVEGKAAREASMRTAREKGVIPIVEGMLPKLVSPSTTAKKPELVKQVGKITLNTSLEGVLGDLAALRERPDSTPTLEQIRIPVLILHGEDDQIIPIQEAQAMQSIILSAEFHSVPNAGHLPNLENPAVFNHTVREFVTKLEAGSRQPTA